MTQTPETSMAEASAPANPAGWWGPQAEIVACSNCQSSFLSLQAEISKFCPNCLHPTLVIMDSKAGLENLAPPELVLPYQVQKNQITASVGGFAKGIPFPPADLNAESIMQRMLPVYLPRWLVDTTVTARWQAETGFNYEVVSHRDRYDQNMGRWVSQEVKETRVSWEPRVGELSRTYQNISAPAADDERRILQAVGEFDNQNAQPYEQSLLLKLSLIKLPNRLPQDAWNDAVIEAQKAAAAECQLASKADHIRNFKWQPDYTNQNWTLLLRPIFVSYYLDDDGQPQRILLNGISGKLAGQRRSSMKRAQSVALTIVLVAAGIFLLGLLLGAVGLVFPPALIIGGLVLLAATFIGLGAIVPIVQAWQFNKSK
jgi:hypothetical protein